MQGAPPHEAGGLLQDLLCALRPLPQVDKHSVKSFHSLQPPSTIQILLIK